MAPLTIKLVSQTGKLVILDDEMGKIGTGRAQPSKSMPGYITLTLRIQNRVITKSGVKSKEFLVLRVPINWLEIP